ncbi:substrate-binding domain-containing protein [Kitasatospora sp. NBC_00458]|uniref:substrate-binding domain-containing protein n=1 Tax=Kitasatospora sp. NBC_00458 TaxID=2903568 RepID=UPI002E1785EA
MRKAFLRLLVSSVLACSLAGGVSGTATADPAGTPRAEDIVGVGGHTTGPVLSALSAAYNAHLAGTGDTVSPRLYSWDAFGPSPIVPKAGSTPIGRPIGAEAGLIALDGRPTGGAAGLSALNGTTGGTVDFARVERPPSYTAGDPASDLFVALGKDAVSWAAKDGGHAPPNLSTAQLKGIYECTVTNWRQIDPSLPNAVIKPYLPHYGAALKWVFLKALGGSGTAIQPGACVVSGVQEDQGTDPVLNDPDVVVPYSVGHYIGQVFGGRSQGSDAAGPLTVRSVNGIAPVADTAAGKSINTAFAVTAYGHAIYNVVRSEEWNGTGAHSAALRNIFGTSGWICGTAGAEVIRSYGFLALPTMACGSVTHS